MDPVLAVVYGGSSRRVLAVPAPAAAPAAVQDRAGALPGGAGPAARQACRPAAGLIPSQVASTQAPSRRVRPLPSRLRRFSAAVRRLSQAWFLATPR